MIGNTRVAGAVGWVSVCWFRFRLPRSLAVREQASQLALASTETFSLPSLEPSSFPVSLVLSR
jgi:hypothetical protein